MGGRASAASKNKYNAKVYDRVALVLRKGTQTDKAYVQAAADAAGESLNGYITKAIAQRMEREGALPPRAQGTEDGEAPQELL